MRNWDRDQRSPNIKTKSYIIILNVLSKKIDPSPFSTPGLLLLIKSETSQGRMYYLKDERYGFTSKSSMKGLLI